MTREEAIKVLEMFLHKQCDLERTKFAYDANTVWEAVNMASEALEQEPKTGHWIAKENEEMKTVGYFCSECDLPMETEKRTDFCPNCGAKMVKPQESEVRNEQK